VVVAVLPILAVHLLVVLVVVLIAAVDKAQETLHQYHLHKEIRVEMFLQVVDLSLVLVVVELAEQVAIIVVLLLVLAEQVFNFRQLSEIQIHQLDSLDQDQQIISLPVVAVVENIRRDLPAAVEQVLLRPHMLEQVLEVQHLVVMVVQQRQAADLEVVVVPPVMVMVAKVVLVLLSSHILPN
tara:strand:+ start:60 stop:605 length:546 start_codon:yes stop_codon:yes gene_type:complete